VKVAYFSPLPPERSGVADYSALLLPALRERLDVEVVPRGRKRLPRGADVALFHMGNDPESHGWILEALRGHPGVVVLHELVLHHLVAGLTLGRRDVATYLAAMEREAGLVGRLLGLGVVDGCIPPLWESRAEDFPLAGLVLESAEGHGLIAHSRYVLDGARAAGYSGPAWRIPHPAWPEPAVEPVDLGRDGPVIGCLGNLNASKRIPQLLEAFALLLERRPDARLLLVGAAAPRLGLPELLGRSGLPSGSILREERVEEARFWSLMAACDVVVGLRAPTMGETSGSAIRALSLGRPLVVSDVGWFAELPSNAVWKVPVDEREVAVLAAGLERLAGDPGLRAAMGTGGRELVRTEHDLERVADRYAAALEEAAGGPAVRDAVAAEVAAAAAEVGIDAGSPEAAELGARLREARVGE
jgi:glycosyltransferase involved in cell wall biosynthesis